MAKIGKVVSNILKARLNVAKRTIKMPIIDPTWGIESTLRIFEIERVRFSWIVPRRLFGSDSGNYTAADIIFINAIIEANIAGNAKPDIPKIDCVVNIPPIAGPKVNPIPNATPIIPNA